jgi:hypothetical protein
MKEGTKVKGIYYGKPYQGTIRKVRPYMGNDKNLYNYQIYYINLDKIIISDNQLIKSFCIDGMAQLNSKVTIREEK